MTTSTHRRNRGGFTLIEILIVIVIIGVLAALLLPAIGSAVRKARETAVSTEINTMAQALSDFKSKYGDYPPSRLVLAENGDYSPALATTQTYTLSTGGGDISDQVLYQRSLRFLRKFFPRMNLSTTGPVWQSSATATNWYDFNGFVSPKNTNSGGPDPVYVLSGHECLVFFLGGVPVPSVDSNGTTVYAMTGFSRNPTNPFPPGTAGGGTNRQPALFEFSAGRLVDGDGDGIPSYQDSFGTNKYYVYFSAYGANAYDPNDDNLLIPETDTMGNPTALKYQVGFVTQTANISNSAPPNPYTASLTVPGTTTSTPVTYQAPQTFQIISAGVDGLFGPGGSYASTGGTPLALDPSFGQTNTVYLSTDPAQRLVERDNVANFHSGRLE